MKQQWILDESVRSAIEETWAVLTGSDKPNPALFLVRLANLARSNAFLWAETGLQVQERSTRTIQVGQGLSRSLVLATVAADILVGYTTLRERAKWLPALVKPRDWQLQHQRSANRVLETAASLGGALIKACQFASTRPDLLPAVYIRTLAPLQDRMPPRSWTEIKKAITRELGRPPEEVFAHIEHEPIAAASIGQVHRGQLHDGRAVAIVGIGQGAYVAVDLALGSEVLPDHGREAAKDMAVFNCAAALPPTIAPAIALIFLGIGGGTNYTALFIAAAVYALLGAVAIQPVKGVR